MDTINTSLFHREYINKCVNVIKYLKYAQILPLELICLITSYIWDLRSEPVLVLTHFTNCQYARDDICTIKSDVLKLYPQIRICVIKYFIAGKTKTSIPYPKYSHNYQYEHQLVPGCIWDLAFIDNTYLSSKSLKYQYMPLASYIDDFILWIKISLCDPHFIKEQNSVI